LTVPTWRVDAAAKVRVQGRLWRMLSPRWAHDPLSGAGAARFGGRWNARDRPALYLSEDHGTAIAEYMQGFVHPGTLTPYTLDVERVLDLTDAATRSTVGVDVDSLALHWRTVRDVDKGMPASWTFSEAAVDAGFDGLRVRSAQATGWNIVLWRWNVDKHSRATVVDPDGDLPRNAKSWLP